MNERALYFVAQRELRALSRSHGWFSREAAEEQLPEGQRLFVVMPIELLDQIHHELAIAKQTIEHYRVDAEHWRELVAAAKDTDPCPPRITWENEDGEEEDHH